MAIPRCMSTQHPDNARTPFFSDGDILSGDTEIKEAYFVFSQLGVKEQLWDYEGKEVDGFVVRKLLERYGDYFRKHQLGTDHILTVRIPNPELESTEAKILLETLEAIPRNHDVASKFYKMDTTPISEIALPMTSSSNSLNRVYHYYKDFVIGKQEQKVYDIKLSQWIGKFKPKSINVIPLLEDKEAMLSCDRIVEEYMKGKDLAHQRVWLARSDPAVNYGQLATVIINKVALQRLDYLQKRTGVEIYPIIGVGTAPFRGNFSPLNMRNCISGYPSVQTFTIQSAFKYDYDINLVQKAVSELQESRRGTPFDIEEKAALDFIARSEKEYQKDMIKLLPMVHKISPLVPARRKRKLHIGLWGYFRKHGGVQMPRAITYCASLYSIGIPPEMLGVGALSNKDIDFLQDAYPLFAEDLADALKFFNKDSLKKLDAKLAGRLKNVAKRFQKDIDISHAEITGRILDALKNNRTEIIPELISEAARKRCFLG